ncbi:hypothetical protein WR25_05603 [Diploscapter pachys]|uniref:Uncharacterized protein n=1 Tax=Diploscapter pachys TaxID=2018661 RepID=A0A2A2KNL5_9BILA|nr:hypothetical protein WR25_05603 [Diploscapter pachys]
MMMVIPVSSHKLIKIRKVNRKNLTKLALLCSFAACTVNLVGSFSNHWLYTSEVLQYYQPNNTRRDSSDINVYFKNATIGPFKFCWLDPATPYHCVPVSYLQYEDPSDVTTSVQQSMRRSFPLMIMGIVLDVLGFCLSVLSYRLPNPYKSLLFASIVHINTGIVNFACIIVFMSSLSKEVGNKIYPASEFDEPLFHFHYGFSFLLIKV